ncbi:MAG: ABC transporter permease [Methanomassiliicoccales archaeon]|nr:ABC transporter permease [Methanomassiliicoccales archaeon]
MSALLDHLRKDMQLLRSDSLFTILFVLTVVIAFVVAFQSSAAYVNSWWTPSLTTIHSIEETQRESLDSYWQNLSTIYLIIFAIFSSVAIIGEKESGMVRYILTFRTSRWEFFLSKFIILTTIALFAILISSVAYLIVFWAMDIPRLGIGDVLSSMVLPFLLVMIICTMGLMVSALMKKKGSAIALGIVLFMVISLSYNAIVGWGEEAAQQDPDWQWDYDAWDYMPWQYKMLIKINPMVLIFGEEQGYINTTEGLLLGLTMIAAFFALGLLFFARERTEYGLIKDLMRKFRGRGDVEPKRE